MTTGCQRTEDLRGLLDGGGMELPAVEVTSYVENQQKVLRDLMLSANILPCKLDKDGYEIAESPAGCKRTTDLTPEQWPPIVWAGIALADQKCERYMNALFWVDRAKDRTINQIGLAGTATAAILGIANAAAEAIAITAVGFGLATATTENIGSGLLYSLDPSAVRSLVKTMQAVYLIELESGQYRNRPTAFWAIQRYISFCLPASIETQVTKAVQRANPEALTLQSGVPPEIGIGIRDVLIQTGTTAADEAVQDRLIAFIKQPGNVDKFRAALQKVAPDLDVQHFTPVLRDRIYADLRRKIAEELKL
ncbi:hypothetical protein JL100_032855 (plasmid) [Skermanella mucosa]|uniref:hypothetical protein n=1 Tax=Skermanella mucosa TaxID=1789672 RepID=UPI00192B46E6|nr:hypothetical protein [Skermanella mucosa]UEM24412.1 hypothetical protein JL100_032855 [Skermanella mucosa]